MIKQKPYQSRTFKKCLDIIEQLRYDLDKYIGMWRSQCNIAEEVMKERDRYKAALAEAIEEAKVWQDRYRKRGYVMDEHAKALERAEVAEAELARYKQGVEVEGLVAYENYPWPIRILDTALEKFHHECVRVLVMKVEE